MSGCRGSSRARRVRLRVARPGLEPGLDAGPRPESRVRLPLWRDRMGRDRRDALARRRPGRWGRHVGRLPRGQDQLGGTRAVAPGDIPPVGREGVRRRVGGRLMGGHTIIEAVQPRRQDIALLVGEKLLDRVRLLDVRHEPVPDARPGRVRVTAEHQLPPRGVDLQALRAVAVAPEGRVDHQARADLLASVDDLGLAAEGLAENLIYRLRRIAADGAPSAGLLRRPHLRPGERIDGIDGADMPGVEVDRVVEEEVDLRQLLLLDVYDRVGKFAELARMVPVAMAEDDGLHVVGIEPNGRELGTEAIPAAPKYLGTCRRMGITVLPPDVNDSDSDFTPVAATATAGGVAGPEPRAVRYGLSAVRNVGEQVVEGIVAARRNKGRFTDFFDFCDKVDASALNKRVVESLVKAGAFDSFGHSRKGLLEIHDKHIDDVLARKRAEAAGQFSLFGGLVHGADEAVAQPLPSIGA